MENPKFEMVQEGKETVLVIKCKLPMKKGEAEKSKSGKSLLFPSTNGNLNTGIKIQGNDLIVGLNAYTKI